MSIRVARILGSVAVLAGLLWFFTFGSFEQEVRMSVAGGYPTPEFNLPVLDAELEAGDTTWVRSADLEGRVVLLAFRASWCSPCLVEQPELLALQEEFADEGLTVLGVLHQDREAAALRLLTESDRLAFRTVVGTPAFARASRVGGLPHTALIDRGGMVKELFLGYWPERAEYVREAVRGLLEVPPPLRAEEVG